MMASLPSVFAVAILFLSFAEDGNAYMCVTEGTNNLLCRLEATQDTFVYDATNQNFHDFLIVGQHPRYPLKRSLLQFESIPSTCRKVEWAVMNVHYWYAHKASFMSEQQVPFYPRPIEVHQVLRSWKETQVTRDRRVNGVSWSSPYLGLANTDAKSYVDDVQVISRYTTRGYIRWDITTIASNWRAGQGNFGVILSAENEALLGREIRFYSREHSSGNKPYVEVYCLKGSSSSGGGSNSGGGGGNGGGGGGGGLADIRATFQ